MSRLAEALAGWEAGAHHHIPLCCRARWLTNPLRPALLSRVAPKLSRRLRHHLRPRYTVADGVVPCEAHLVWFLLTGRRPVPDDQRNNSAEGFCCEHREAMDRSGGVELSPVNDPDYGRYTALHIGGEEQFSLTHCPWCGESLADGS